MPQMIGDCLHCSMVDLTIRGFLLAWSLDLDRTVWYNPGNWEPLTNMVLLTTRTVLCIKSMKLFEPRLNRLDLRTVNDSHGSDQRFKKKKKK